MSFIETERLRPATYASLARRRSRERLFDRLALAILVALVCVIAITFRDYSISTDEEVQNTYGRLLLDFYLSGLTDTRAFGYSNLYLYGGLFDLIAAAIAPFSPLPDFEARHLLCATFGVLGIVATWRLARLLATPRAGLLAVVLLVLCPAYYGAMFNNTKDIPFAAGMTWTLYLSCRLVACLPRPPFRLVAWLGVAAGASLGVRVGAVLAGLYLIPVLALHVFDVARAGGWRASVRSATSMLLRLSPGILIAAALMAVLWPWSVMAPGNMLLAVHDLTGFHVSTILAGRPLDSYDVPAWYVPTYLLVKLPETLLIGLVVALAAAAIPGRRPDRAAPLARPRQWLLVVLAASIPVAYAVVARPAIYNGLRHFLLVVPPLCVLAGSGIDRVLVAAGKWGGRPGMAMAAILFAAASAKDVWTMAALHPHQYVYYNLLAGGVRGADGRYELDYWSNFMREAIDRLVRHVVAENGGHLPKRTFIVDLCTSPWPLRAYAPPQFKMTEDCRAADFFISTTNTNCHQGCDGRTIIEIDRMGVALGVVKDRRDRKADDVGSRAAATR
ncbi:MAG: glycosyltransferase family 39 protein [Bacteroidota bacterium]